MNFKPKTDRFIQVHMSSDGVKEKYPIPVFSGGVPAGFASPADGYLEGSLDLWDLIDHPASTFFTRAADDSMEGYRIFTGDLISIDRSLVDYAINADFDVPVLINVDSEPAIRILRKEKDGETVFLSANPDYKTVTAEEFTEYSILGVPTFNFRPLLKQKIPIKDGKLDLHDLIEHPEATFFVQAFGDSMKDYRIFDRDLIMIDRSLMENLDRFDYNDFPVMTAVDGEFTLKLLHKNADGEKCLLPANPDYPPIPLTGEMESVIWGLPAYSIRPIIGHKFPIKDLPF